MADKDDTRPTHLVFLDGTPVRNAGGPVGYVWHLRKGVEHAQGWRGGAAGEISIQFLTKVPGSAKQDLSQSSSSWQIKLRKLGTLNAAIKALDARYWAQWARIVANRLNVTSLPAWAQQAVVAEHVTSIHCHRTVDLLRVHNTLVRIKRRRAVRLALTSHTPEIPALEEINNLLAAGLPPSASMRLQQSLEAIDLAAFRCADLLVFPCREAMEPYYETSEQFGDAIEGKPVSFVLTGIEEPLPTRTLLLPEYDDVLKFVYVGRHTHVKGYDLLAETAPGLLPALNGVVLVAGSLGPVQAPSSPKWKELGWMSDPSSLIRAADCLLLPNRRTFFDIVALEALALGIPVLLSATGGNKALAQYSKGIELFDLSQDGLAKAMINVASWSKEERISRAINNRRSYEEHFTSRIFGVNYRAMVTDWSADSKTPHGP